MSKDRDPPNIFIFIFDCLRQASATPENLPFISDFCEQKYTRCYSPSTWTLPSHISLFTGTEPFIHQVTRRTNFSEKGDEMHSSMASLPPTTGSNYKSAIFSENPHFSRRAGFGHKMDLVDDWINSKLYLSDFSVLNHISPAKPSFYKVPDILAKVGRSDEPLRNSINVLYGGYKYFTSSEDDFPYNGPRVLDHISSFNSRSDSPRLAITNLMETHNPHHIPPEQGAAALNKSFDEERLRSLGSVSDNRYYLFTEDKEIPEERNCHFRSWDEIFKLSQEVYNTQIRYADILIEHWIKSLSDTLREDSIFIFTGDHGQLFGEEKMAGHHTSLHPHAINVPLLISFPDNWTSKESTLNTVTSWIDLNKTIQDVMCGKIKSANDFKDSMAKSTTATIAVDGSGFNSEELLSDPKFDNELIKEKLETRKVGIIKRNQMYVYESKWDSKSVSKSKYILANNQREIVEKNNDIGKNELSPKIWNWLIHQPDGNRSQDSVDRVIKERLESLGYK